MLLFLYNETRVVVNSRFNQCILSASSGCSQTYFIHITSKFKGLNGQKSTLRKEFAELDLAISVKRNLDIEQEGNLLHEIEKCNISSISPNGFLLTMYGCI